MTDGAEQNRTSGQPWHRHPAVRFGLWVIGGAIAGYFVGGAIAEYEDQIPALGRAMQVIASGSLSETLAFIVAAGLIAMGIMMLVMSRFSDASLRGALNADPDDNPSRMRKMLPIAGWGMLLYAAIILSFLIPGIPAAAGIAIVLGCFAVVSWLFWRGTLMMDELEQAAQREALMATFIIVEAVGIGWAALHHHALAPAIEPVALVTLLTVIYYTAGVIAAVRRGLAQ